MNVEKVFVKKNDLAIIKCPQCGLVKKLSVTSYRQNRKPLKIQCTCNHVFTILLDFRRHFRKKVTLPGTYTLKPPAEGTGYMTVINISRNGVGFTVSAIHTIVAGQKARIKFTLDDPKQTQMEKEVEIVAVNKNLIGCAFLDAQQFEKDLGFYLRS